MLEVILVCESQLQSVIWKYVIFYKKIFLAEWSWVKATDSNIYLFQSVYS